MVFRNKLKSMSKLQKSCGVLHKKKKKKFSFLAAFFCDSSHARFVVFNKFFDEHDVP